MNAKHGFERRTRVRGSIGSYGTRPWEADYDHDSFLSEMVPVSFSEVGADAMAAVAVDAGAGMIMDERPVWHGEESFDRFPDSLFPENAEVENPELELALA